MTHRPNPPHVSRIRGLVTSAFVRIWGLLLGDSPAGVERSGATTTGGIFGCSDFGSPPADTPFVMWRARNLSVLFPTRPRSMQVWVEISVGDRLWEGYHESRKCSSDACSEPYITKYTRMQRQSPMSLQLDYRRPMDSPAGVERSGATTTGGILGCNDLGSPPGWSKGERLVLVSEVSL